jgi:hypothetical protein
MTSGSISFSASLLLVGYILRSYESLSTTYHRLIFGLSAADIISSLFFALSSTLVPTEMSYLVPFASGNVATCDAQGFLITFCGAVSVGYNCSICFYYLAIITYNKKFDYIEQKLEPWFHGVSISIPLVYTVIRLATNTFNGPNGGTCLLDPHDPPHCIGYEAGDIPEGYSIPCGRGGENDGLADLRSITGQVAFFWVLIIAPIIILVTMVRMFRSVAKVAKQIQKRGASALPLRTSSSAVPTSTNNNSTDQQELSQKRAFLLKAFGYAVAWLLVSAPYIVFIVYSIAAKSVPDAVVIFISSTVPLQGFYNFVVFMTRPNKSANDENDDYSA